MSQLLSNLPTGAKVKFGKFQVNTETAQPIVWTVVAKNHKCTPAYPTNAITLHAAGIIDLRYFDAREPSNSNSRRQRYGNNRYSVSNIDQWLNKDAAGGAWYVAAHSADHPPDNSTGMGNPETPYANRPGFLNAFSGDEKAAILSTTIRVVKPSVDGGSYEDIMRKMFLPSTTEVGLADENSIAEGAAWGYYTSNTARIGYPTHQCYSNTQSTSLGSETAAWYWCLRTPPQDDAEYTWIVSGSGDLSTTMADISNNGIRPALNLSSSLLVSDITDADGCYTFVWDQAPTTPSYINVPASVYGGKSATIDWGASTNPNGDLSGYILQRKVGTGSWIQVYKGANRSYIDSITYGWTTVQYRVCAYDSQGVTGDYRTSDSRTVINKQAPAISGSDGNLGTKNTEFSQTYTVTDVDGDSITVEESIDNEVVRSYVVTLGATNTFSVTGETWLEQSNGSHTMKIKATDSIGNTTTRTYIFTKSVNGFTIQNTTPYTSDDCPTRIKITVARSIPAESTFKVYVCNNGFDDSPTWEDATTSVTGGLVHVFSNTTRTSATWGIVIKVNVNRGEGEGACYVSRIGGNFEVGGSSTPVDDPTDGIYTNIADGSITTAKYADNSITSAKIANGAKLGIEQGMFPVNKFLMNIDTINEKITVSDSLLIFTDTYFYILQAGNYSYSDVAGVTDKTLINVYAKKNNGLVINQLIFKTASSEGSSSTSLDKNLIYLFTFTPGLSMETVTPYQPVLINGVKARHRGEPAVNIDELNSCFTSKNLFNKNTVIKGFKGNVSSTTGAFAIDTTYCTSEYIPVDGSTAYYSNVDAIITQYNKGYGYLSRTTAKSITTLSNTRYVKISIPIADLDEEQFEKGTSSSSYESYNLYLKSSHLKHKNVVIVDKQNGDYSTINAAVQANNGETIIVMPGDYYENVRAWVNKPINIVGVDKNKCILRHGCGQYENPPLEIAAGYVKNMTIYADSTNPLVSPSDTNGKSYAVHVESDYSANRELTFENCILKSNWHAAIGIGLRPNFKLTLKNCDLYSNYEKTYIGSLSKHGSLGALFFHPSAGYSSENQNLILDNCRLYSINDIVLCDYDVGISPYKATITAINTMLWSETKGKQQSVIFHRVAPSGEAWGGSHIFLDGKSYGNNVEGLNS